MTPLGKIPTSRFTLVELIIVIVIILILLSMLLPQTVEIRNKSKAIACMQNLHRIGLALVAYEHDYFAYPVGMDVAADLDAAGYLPNVANFRCMRDTSGRATYNYGYVAGNAKTMDAADALVVCGWHKRSGILGVFRNAEVMPLNQVQNHPTLPVSMTFSGGSANPGFVLHNSDPLVLHTDTGESAYLTGKDGTYLVGASYDPLANNGAGQFNVILGHNLNSPAKQEAEVASAQFVRFTARLKYATIEVLSDPNHDTKLEWYLHGDHTHLDVDKYQSYKLSHLLTGEVVEDNAPGSQNHKVYPTYVDY